MLSFGLVSFATFEVDGTRLPPCCLQQALTPNVGKKRMNLDSFGTRLPPCRLQQALTPSVGKKRMNLFERQDVFLRLRHQASLSARRRREILDLLRRPNLSC